MRWHLLPPLLAGDRILRGYGCHTERGIDIGGGDVRDARAGVAALGVEYRIEKGGGVSARQCGPLLDGGTLRGERPQRLPQSSHPDR